MRAVRMLAALSFLFGSMAFAGPLQGVLRVLGATGDGRPADITLRGLDGQPVSLSRFLGKKPVLLVFWATWCPECKSASPKINALHDGLSGEKVQILAIDYRETPERVAAAVKSLGIR